MAIERLRSQFGLKVFAAVVSVSAVVLTLAGVLVARALVEQTAARIERGLIAEARLAAELLGQVGLAGATDLDREADRLSALVHARVTFIRRDGVVVGDSAGDGAALEGFENHGRRPEVDAARAAGIGVSRRYSTTVDTDMLYVAVPVRHPTLAFVRLALPLTEVQQQLRAVRRATAAALAVALVAAVGIGWGASRMLSRRVRALAAAAERHRTGETASAASSMDYGGDELGRVARTLDLSMQDLALRASEANRARVRLEAILAGMAEGVLVVDEAGRLELANEAARTMLRFQADRAGRSLVEAVRHPAIVELVGSARSGAEDGEAEVELATSDGATLVAGATPFSAGGAAGTVIVLRDVTSLRRTEQMRRDFVANVSHELRTPLAAIRGYVEALREQDYDGERQERFLEIIERHTERMERLVRDLLRLARIEAGQEELEIRPVVVRELFEQVAADLAPRTRGRDQRVDMQVPENLVIAADPGKIEDILKNLVENASQYGPEGSAITLAAARTPGWVEISVSDQGSGIPEQHLQRIFQRFYRVDPARSRQSGGTGLGLSIVKHLSELLGGRVEAANQPRGGAIFRVVLPERHAAGGSETPI